ncbi:MAG: DNA polymerase domain-containing protein [Candidatus Thermoplasmatota archaeon]
MVNMSDLLLGVSSNNLYYQGKRPVHISTIHDPYFLVYTPRGVSLKEARSRLIRLVEEYKGDDSSPLSRIKSIGDIEVYQSFNNPKEKREVFKVYTKASYVVPEVSDCLFFDHGFYTAEHDIPYQQRVLTDLAADDKAWLLDTNGERRNIKVLIYDIELTQYEEGRRDLPIDIIGYADFNIGFTSDKNLDREEFNFEIHDIPSSWSDIEVKQLVSRSIDDEIDNLCEFCNMIEDYDIVSGHNILGFDNYQLYGRIKHLMSTHNKILSDEEYKVLQGFLEVRCSLDRSFHFGVGSEVIQIYPSCFDTYLASRKFYSFLDEFNLKSLALFLGVILQDRLYLQPSQIRFDDRTLKYNRQDVQEQIGVTLNLIQQALPLAFITCMPFDMLLPSGAVNMWDHMAIIRSKKQRKIMPPVCRARAISQILLDRFKDCKSRSEIVTSAKRCKEQLSKDFIRVLKYGEEMPEWVEYPYVIYDPNVEDDQLGYHLPGGMTIKPDTEVHSDFIPWYHVVVADVGAMYPTILKALNLGADTVRLALKNEKPDTWIWLKRLPERFLRERDILWREITSRDSYADTGVMLGVIIDKKTGVVNCAMTGIMNMIKKIKKELKQAYSTKSAEEVKRLQMMYQSMKGARNAGSHGILSAPLVTGRQFNIWGAAAITTTGQMILADTLNYLKNQGIRVVYGDTDGIYIGCSRSAGNLLEFSKALGIKTEVNDDAWLTRSEQALSAIKHCNEKWQKELKYPDFELEAEVHDAMIFVKHKNYLIFDAKHGKVEMITKGNNFKGSDKPDIARKVLEQIMIQVLKENTEWNDEEEARKNVKESITRNTKEMLSKLDLSTVELEDLTLIQSVQPANRYKLNQDQSTSVYGTRASALEKLLNEKIKTRVKLKFVVTKHPLPGIPKPSKSGVKPIDYMYPVDLLESKEDIDLEWYKKMIENYINGAFGLSRVNVIVTRQKGLDEWM